MTLEGPILSLQPASVSSVSSSLSSFHIDPPEITLVVSSPDLSTVEDTSMDSASTQKNRLGPDGISREKSPSLGDCKSAPNSPTHQRQSFFPSLDRELLSNSLSPHSTTQDSKNVPRSSRAGSFDPANSLNLNGTPKVSLSTRFMRRAPTIDTNDITKEEFEDYTRVNQYKVLDIIGHGSYGIVRKATDDNDEVFAMKIVNKKKLLRKGFTGRVRPGMKPRSSPRENMEREIAILKKLNHPNVVHLFEVLDDAQEVDLILVLEYVQKGPVIDKFPMDKAFSEHRSKKYFIDLILGLEYLHSQHVIHRDIKPQNLLLDVNDTIKIADFGVSEQIITSDANLSKSAGTPAFVAPETLSSVDAFRGQGVDVWASGITLFCFMFGNVPWTPPSIPELYDMIKSTEIAFPKDVPVSAELKDLLTKLLTKDPEKRATLSEIRLHPWVCSSPRYIPSKEENCNEKIDVSEEDIQKAIRPFYTPIHILLMIKQMAKRRSLRNPKSYSITRSPSCSPSVSPPTSPRHTPLPPTSKDSTNDPSETTKGISQNKRDKFATTRNAPSIFVEDERVEF